MKTKAKFAVVIAAFAAFSSPLFAQQAITFVEREAWDHPHGALPIPAELAGLVRYRGASYADDTLDIGVAYRSGSTEATLYVFRKTNGSVPIWFAQASDAIIARDGYDQPKIFGEVQTIAPGASSVATGLKAVFEPGGDSSVASTGLAVFEVDGWYVKLRVTSNSMSVGDLSAWMERALSDLEVADGYKPASVIAPIEDCPNELDYHNRTRDVKPDGASSLLGGLLGLIAAQSVGDDEERAVEPAESTLWCRDSFIDPGRATYRRFDATDSFLFALGDSGAAVLVAPDAAAALLGAADGSRSDVSYAVTLMQASRNVNFVSQDKFPSPKRVLKILEKGHTTSVVSTWGEGSTIEINSDTL